MWLLGVVVMSHRLCFLKHEICRLLNPEGVTMHGDRAKTDRLKFAVVGAGAAGFLNSRVLSLFFKSLSNNDSNLLPHITLYESNYEVMKGASHTMARRQGVVHFSGEANRRVMQQGTEVLNDIFTNDHHFKENPSSAPKLTGGFYAIGNEANTLFNPEDIMASLDEGIVSKSLKGLQRVPVEEYDSLLGRLDEGGTMRKQAIAYYRSEEGVYDIEWLTERFNAWIRKLTEADLIEFKPGTWVEKVIKQPLTTSRQFNFDLNKMGFKSDNGLADHVEVSSGQTVVRSISYALNGQVSVEEKSFDLVLLNAYDGNESILRNSGVPGVYEQLRNHEEQIQQHWVESNQYSYRAKKAVRTIDDEGTFGPDLMCIYGPNASSLTQTRFNHKSHDGVDSFKYLRYHTVENRTNTVVPKHVIPLITRLHDFNSGSRYKFVIGTPDDISWGSFWFRFFKDVVIGLRGKDLPEIVNGQTELDPNSEKFLFRDRIHYTENHLRRIQIIDMLTIDLTLISLMIEKHEKISTCKIIEMPAVQKDYNRKATDFCRSLTTTHSGLALDAWTELNRKDMNSQHPLSKLWSAIKHHLDSAHNAEDKATAYNHKLIVSEMLFAFYTYWGCSGIFMGLTMWGSEYDRYITRLTYDNSLRNNSLYEKLFNDLALVNRQSVYAEAYRLRKKMLAGRNIQSMQTGFVFRNVCVSEAQRKDGTAVLGDTKSSVHRCFPDKLRVNGDTIVMNTGKFTFTGLASLKLGYSMPILRHYQKDGHMNKLMLKQLLSAHYQFRQNIYEYLCPENPVEMNRIIRDFLEATQSERNLLLMYKGTLNDFVSVVSSGQKYTDLIDRASKEIMPFHLTPEKEAHHQGHSSKLNTPPREAKVAKQRFANIDENAFFTGDQIDINTALNSEGKRSADTSINKLAKSYISANQGNIVLHQLFPSVMGFDKGYIFYPRLLNLLCGSLQKHIAQGIYNQFENLSSQDMTGEDITGFLRDKLRDYLPTILLAIAKNDDSKTLSDDVDAQQCKAVFKIIDMWCSPQHKDRVKELFVFENKKTVQHVDALVNVLVDEDNDVFKSNLGDVNTLFSPIMHFKKSALLRELKKYQFMNMSSSPITDETKLSEKLSPSKSLWINFLSKQGFEANVFDLNGIKPFSGLLRVLGRYTPFEINEILQRLRNSHIHSRAGSGIGISKFIARVTHPQFLRDSVVEYVFNLIQLQKNAMYKYRYLMQYDMRSYEHISDKSQILPQYDQTNSRFKYTGTNEIISALVSLHHKFPAFHSDYSTQNSFNEIFALEMTMVSIYGWSEFCNRLKIWLANRRESESSFKPYLSFKSYLIDLISPDNYECDTPDQIPLVNIYNSVINNEFNVSLDRENRFQIPLEGSDCAISDEVPQSDGAISDSDISVCSLSPPRDEYRHAKRARTDKQTPPTNRVHQSFNFHRRIVHPPSIPRTKDDSNEQKTSAASPAINKFSSMLPIEDEQRLPIEDGQRLRNFR